MQQANPPVVTTVLLVRVVTNKINLQKRGNRYDSNDGAIF